jgi:squalene synthase HpnC
MTFDKNKIFGLSTPDGGEYHTENLAEGYDFCRKTALAHYENFPVGSALIPKSRRRHIYAVYAFARLADDIADELTDIAPEIRIAALDSLEELLYMNTGKINGNPIIMALRNTLIENNIPPETPARLLEAFRRDINFRQPETIEDIYDYCHYSANPVGELVLRIFDQATGENILLSDSICTALQMTNFWQDISVDFYNNRVYIPRKLLNDFGLNSKNFISSENSNSLYSCLIKLYDITDTEFGAGASLIDKLKPYRLRKEIAATMLGGRRILKKCRKLKGSIGWIRPALNKTDMIAIFFMALIK